MLSWLFRRRREPAAIHPVAATPAATTPAVSRHPDNLDMIEDCAGIDFDAYESEADTAAFVHWHAGNFANATELHWRNIWNRYHVFCAQHRQRPLSKGQLLLQLRGCGVTRSRARIGSKRITLYNMGEKSALRRVA